MTEKEPKSEVNVRRKVLAGALSGVALLGAGAGVRLLPGYVSEQAIHAQQEKEAQSFHLVEGLKAISSKSIGTTIEQDMDGIDAARLKAQREYEKDDVELKDGQIVVWLDNYQARAANYGDGNKDGQPTLNHYYTTGYVVDKGAYDELTASLPH